MSLDVDGINVIGLIERNTISSHMSTLHIRFEVQPEFVYGVAVQEKKSPIIMTSRSISAHIPVNVLMHAEIKIARESFPLAAMPLATGRSAKGTPPRHHRNPEEYRSLDRIKDHQKHKKRFSKNRSVFFIEWLCQIQLWRTVAENSFQKNALSYIDD